MDADLTVADAAARERARDLAALEHVARALAGQATSSRFKLDPNWLSTQIPPRRFAWYPYLPTHCVSLLIGEGAVGKSTALLAMLVHVAAGLPYLGRPTLQGRVVYVAAEDDEQEVLRRLHGSAAIRDYFQFRALCGRGH
jgi:RecA-family ATPase